MLAPGSDTLAGQSEPLTHMLESSASRSDANRSYVAFDALSLTSKIIKNKNIRPLWPMKTQGLYQPRHPTCHSRFSQLSFSANTALRNAGSGWPHLYRTRACFKSIYNGAALSQPLVFPFANVGVRSVRGAALGPLQHRRGVTLGDERPSLLANMKAPT